VKRFGANSPCWVRLRSPSRGKETSCFTNGCLIAAEGNHWEALNLSICTQLLHHINARHGNASLISAPFFRDALLGSAALTQQEEENLLFYKWLPERSRRQRFGAKPVYLQTAIAS
jgi:hypothetical protein